VEETEAAAAAGVMEGGGAGWVWEVAEAEEFYLSRLLDINFKKLNA
jgi:hypothetical protein